MRKKKSGEIIIASVIFIIVIAFFILPDIWMIFASFQKGATLSTSFITSPTLENYIKVLPQIAVPLMNSLYITLLGTFLCVLVASIASYPLSRYDFKLKDPIMYGMLFLSVLPITAMMVPTYTMFVVANFINKRWAIAFFMAATSLPVTIWIMKNFYDSIPVELEEAAWIDGTTRLGSLFKIVMPLSVPGMTVAAVLAFVGQWGNFYVPFILLSSNNKMPLAVSIYNFFTSRGLPLYGQLAAYSMLYTVVPLVLYFMTAKYLTAGLNIGGLKG